VVYVSSYRNVYALNAATGAKLWRHPTGDFVDSSPAVANGVVYVGDDNRRRLTCRGTGHLPQSIQIQ
jgi:eukaryotic-like serine/threonine-protein kinase